MQATKAAQPSASKSTCKDKQLVLIANEAKRQLENMEPLRKELYAERFKLLKFTRAKMVTDFKHLVASAEKAVDLAKMQQEQVDKEYQNMYEEQSNLKIQAEEIPALEKELSSLTAQIDYLSDKTKLEKNRGQIQAVLTELHNIKQLDDISAILSAVGEAKDNVNYGTYASAFANIPQAPPHAAWLNISTMTGFRTQVQSCLPCTARAFVAAFLQQHGSNPKIQEQLIGPARVSRGHAPSYAIRLVGEGGALLEMVGVEQVKYAQIWLIFVSDKQHAKPTDVDIETAAQKSANSKDDATTNQCNMDHLQLIKHECNGQIKSLEEQQNLLLPKNISATRDKFKIDQEQLAKQIQEFKRADSEWQKTKEATEENLTRLEQRMDDMNIRTQRFIQQQKEAKDKLELYKNENAKSLIEAKLEAFDNVVETLKQIQILAINSSNTKLETLEFIKHETSIDKNDTAALQALQNVYKQIHQIATEAVGTVNVSVRVWTPEGIKKCFPSLCLPCGVQELIDALKEQNAQDEKFVKFLNTMTRRLIIEGKVADWVPKNIVQINSIDVVLHNGAKVKVGSSLRVAEKPRVESGSSRGGSGNSGGGGKAAAAEKQRRRKSSGGGKAVAAEKRW